MGCKYSTQLITFKPDQFVSVLPCAVGSSLNASFVLYQKLGMAKLYSSFQELRVTSIIHQYSRDSSILQNIVEVQRFPFLQILSLSSNGIQSLEAITLLNTPFLKVLDLSDNCITSIQSLRKFRGMGSLVNLNLSKNVLTGGGSQLSSRHWALCGPIQHEVEEKNQRVYIDLSENQLLRFTHDLCLIQQQETVNRPNRRSIELNITMTKCNIICKKVRIACQVYMIGSQAYGNHLEGVKRRFPEDRFTFTGEKGVLYCSSLTKRSFSA